MDSLRTAVQRFFQSWGGLSALWIALTIVALVPVWHHRLLPMLDAPNHLALARGWHNYHDPAWHISDFYDLRIRPVPYLLFYLCIHLLLFGFTIETANKIFLSAYLILFPLTIAYLALALKRSPWLALCSFPLAFNQNWPYGFSSYLIATCFMYLSLAALILYLRDGRLRHVALLVVGSSLAYFAHFLPWFMCGLGAIGLLLFDWRNWRRVLTAALAMAPSLILAIVAVLDERSERAFSKSGESFEALWPDFATSVIEFPDRVLGIMPSHFDMWVLATLAATVVALAVPAWQERAPKPSRETRQLTLLLCIFGFAYLSLPNLITKPIFWWYISARIPSMMAPIILLWPSVRLDGWRRALLLPAIAASFALPLKLDQLYRGFNSRNAPFIEIVDQLPVGKSTLVVYRGIQRTKETSEDPASSLPVYAHFTSWPMALKGGFNPHLFNQGIPIRPRAPLAAPSFLGMDEFTLETAPTFDYYLVHDAPPSMEHEPALKLTLARGSWKLYRRLHELTDKP